MKDPAVSRRVLESFTRLPLGSTCLALAGGLLAASGLAVPLPVWLGLAALSLGLTLLLALVLPRLGRSLPWFPRSAWLRLFLALTAALCGAARLGLAAPSAGPDSLVGLRDQETEVLVQGTLVEPPEQHDAYTLLTVRTASLQGQGEDRPLEGLLLAQVEPGGSLAYGDVLRLRGHLVSPPGSSLFSYPGSPSWRRVQAFMPDGQATRLPLQAGNPVRQALLRLGQAARTRLAALLPGPPASLLAAVLLGSTGELPPQTLSVLRSTGITPAFSLPALNLVLLAGLLIPAFTRPLGLRRGACAALASLLPLVLLSGADAPALEAVLLAGAALLAVEAGGRSAGLRALALAAAMLVLLDPSLPWEASFQLSLGACLGMVLFTRAASVRARAWLDRNMPPGAARRTAAVLAVYLSSLLPALLITLPVLVLATRQFSLSAWIGNPWLTVLVPPLLALGTLTVLAGLVWLPLGVLAGWLSGPLAALLLRLVELFDRPGAAPIGLGVLTVPLVGLYLLLLIGWTFRPDRVQQALRQARRPAAGLAVLGCVSLLVWQAAFSAPDGRLHLVFLEVGTADAVLIQTPGGARLLVNGGGSPARLSEGLGQHLPFFDRRLDWLVVASPQEAQLAALPALVGTVPPGQALWSGSPTASASASELERMLAEAGVPLHLAYRDLALDLGGGARLSVLAVSERGAVLLVELGGFRALLPLGMTLEGLEQLEARQDLGGLTVLLLADSGLAALNPPAWLSELRPQVVVLSVAAGDPQGLPDEQVLSSLSGMNLLRTDRNGWIEVTTDGSRLWLEVERK